MGADRGMWLPEERRPPPRLTCRHNPPKNSAPACATCTDAVAQNGARRGVGVPCVRGASPGQALQAGQEPYAPVMVRQKPRERAAARPPRDVHPRLVVVSAARRERVDAVLLQQHADDVVAAELRGGVERAPAAVADRRVRRARRPAARDERRWLRRQPPAQHCGQRGTVSRNFSGECEAMVRAGRGADRGASRGGRGRAPCSGSTPAAAPRRTTRTTSR